MIMLTFWNPIPGHKMSISINQIGKYDAMQLYSLEAIVNLRIVLEDNDYFYRLPNEKAYGLNRRMNRSFFSGEMLQ
ncbi:hypothetical protein C6I21_14200 [Alkalicoccus urumqiensis]|uniref:Uncharacterized protein n=1 Tax=Alkalicoccus urumqiensis TaxID=1548213 RepID=A0A2P6MDY7_ALKUR|nr:hypothetical protein C6I21_14200 [Alkalicoccus urumqiensis]